VLLFATAFEPDPFTAALLQAAVLLVAIRFLDVWEREPTWLVCALAVWGAAGATILAAAGNDALQGLLSEQVRLVWGPAIYAPVIEESAKGIVLLAALLASGATARHFGIAPQFDGPTDGMVYGAAVGVGFAFAENSFAFLNEAFTSAGREVLAFREGFFNLNTLSHGVYTATLGAGLGLASWATARSARVAFALAGFAGAVLLHTLHNGLTSLILVSRHGLDATALYYDGAPMPLGLLNQLDESFSSAIAAVRALDYALIALFLVALVAWTSYQKRVLAAELEAGVRRGAVTPGDRDLALRPLHRAMGYLRLAREGRAGEIALRRSRIRALTTTAFADWRARGGLFPSPDPGPSRALSVQRARP
jgi:RsiW-degrading membrane proteinase PrsW (M82 family)